MSAASTRSKKRSAVSSKPPPEPLVFFIDRSLGKHLIAGALRQSGLAVEVHDDHLAEDAPDEAWIALVGERRWLAVTKDRNVRYRAGEIEAIRHHGARVLVLRAKRSTAAEMAEILIGARSRIERFVSRNDAPFVAGIDRSGQVRRYAI